MFKKIVPVAIVARIAFAAVGAASAHDVIVPREGFDTALAALEAQSNGQAPASLQTASNAQGQSQSKAKAQDAASVSNSDGSTTVQVLDPSAIRDGWWKDR